ncbi:hypothetical protein N7457_009047 [Penicillium paradoxum]|uniref:uncharacterized protein n=1 Tax=Penicillium paradoxum TaxID=176176 RepID=UPI0025495616|nr:uncharacterized protein N7457_009047 [Penicillium paradoxum]KAJ5774151.1 hypothetical protein N7457_009047 [Penicillium paradoxum]
MALKYPEFEPRGDSLRRWMEKSDEPGCPIPRTEFTLPDRDDPRRHSHTVQEDLTQEWSSWAKSIGLPVDAVDGDPKPSYYTQSIVKTGLGRLTYWLGRTGPGVIFIDNIMRVPDSTDPHISEYTQAFYEMNFPLESLKHVVVTTIVQSQTMDLVEQIYEAHPDNLFPAESPQTWESPSPEFCAILGTPLGKVVGAFVLGAYGQGVKRIARIVSFHTGSDFDIFNLQFDIEDV